MASRQQHGALSARVSIESYTQAVDDLSSLGHAILPVAQREIRTADEELLALVGVDIGVHRSRVGERRALRGLDRGVHFLLDLRIDRLDLGRAR